MQVYGVCIRTLHLPVISIMIIGRFLLGTGQMPHPVGGAMGVTYVR